MISVGERRPRSGRLGAVVLLLTLGAGIAAGWPVIADRVGLGPRSVLVVYVREENSLGLVSLPSPDRTARSCLDGRAGILTLPGRLERVPPRTRALVLRETFVAGLLVEAKVTCLDRLPGLVSARLRGQPDSDGDGEPVRLLEGVVFARVDAGLALLAGDVLVSRPAEAGWDPAAVRVEIVSAVPAGERLVAAVLEPGDEWRLGAVGGPDGVAVVRPDEPGEGDRLRQAFGEGRPVSVLVIANLGLWRTDRIEPAGGSGG